MIKKVNMTPLYETYSLGERTAKIDIQSKIRRLRLKKTQEKGNRQEVEQQERKREKSDRSLEEIQYPKVRS